MRILQFLFASFLLLVMVGGIGFFGAREVLLFMASNQLQTSVFELRGIARNPITYNKDCKAKGAIGTEKLISQVRLRFTSSTDYQLEVLCDQFPFDPIIVKQQSLPVMAQKLPGSAGIIYGNDRSGVGVEVWGRKRDVIVENQEVSLVASGGNSYGVSPVSSCGGYGYRCCEAQTQSGVGELYSQVTDCPKTCYATCQARPVILSFSSDPFPEGNPRTVAVHGNEPVTFSYVTAAAGNPHLLVTIDYGDGQTQEFRETTGDTSHTYSCARPSCTYTAVISVKDGSGGVAEATPLTQIQVAVSQ